MQPFLAENFANTLLAANWPAPQNVIAFATTKHFPKPIINNDKSYQYGFNLALHVKDDAKRVLKRRRALEKNLGLKESPLWLLQNHSNRVLLEQEASHSNQADGAIVTSIKKPAVVLTADCLPILLTNRKGSFVAAIHGGWRGLYNGIIDNCIVKLAKMNLDDHILAWIGPGVCRKCYQVGQEFRDNFMLLDQSYEKFFTKDKQKEKKKGEEKYLADLSMMAYSMLTAQGVSKVYFSDVCTACNDDFYSYRRNKQTGRFASLIYLNNE